MSNNFRLTTAAGLGLLLASLAAPIALADTPGYLFRDFGHQSPAADSGSADRAATDAQIAAANRKADQALATAQEAIQEAQQAEQQQAKHQQPMQQVR